jgi:hypothetical protein
MPPPSSVTRKVTDAGVTSASMTTCVSAGVLEPGLLARLVDAGKPIEPPLDGAHRRGKECPLAFQHGSHEGAQRSRRGDDENQHEGDLQPSVERHGSVQLIGAPDGTPVDQSFSG